MVCHQGYTAERELHRQQLESLQDKIRKRGSDTDQELDKAEQNQRWELQRDNLKAEQMKKSDLSQQVLSALEQLKRTKPRPLFRLSKNSELAGSRLPKG